MSFHVDRFINDLCVEPGVLITGLLATGRVLGSTIKAGARCDSFHPRAMDADRVGR